MHISATDGQLNTRYKHVLFFIYPSTYEGFGLPILAAYRNKCPALLSDMSCFPEVAGRAVAFFETNAMDSLIEQIDLLLTDSAYRGNLVRLGKDKIKEYTLKRCLEETIAVYKSL